MFDLSQTVFVKESRKLLNVAMPIILSGVFQRLYDFVDLFWISRLGLSAISVGVFALYVNSILFFTGFIISNGTMVVGSQEYHQDRNSFSRIVRTSIIGSGILAVSVIIICFIAISAGVSELFVDEELVSTANRFLLVTILTVPASYSFNLFVRLLSITKKNAIVPKVKFVLLIVNFLLDPIFIIGLGSFAGFGVVGAAITTAATKYVGVWILLILTDIKRDFVSGAFDKQLLIRIIKSGFPFALTMILKPLFDLLVYYNINNKAPHILADYIIASRIVNLIFLVSIGFEISIAREASMEMADYSDGIFLRKDLLKRILSKFVLTLFVLTGFIFMLNWGSEWLGKIFLRSEMSPLFEEIFQYRMLVYPGLTLILIFQGYLRGMNASVYTIFSTNISWVFIGILVSLSASIPLLTLSVPLFLLVEGIINMISFFVLMQKQSKNRRFIKNPIKQGEQKVTT